MRLLFACVLLVGCARIWDADSYRGGDAAPVDARADVEDLDPDADVIDADFDARDDDDAGLDADVGRDARVPFDSGVCELTPGTAPMEVRGSLRDLTITYNGVGPALRVLGSGARLTNLEILLSGPATGILIDPGVEDVHIENVRIVKSGGGTSPGQFAIRAEGPSEDIMLHNVTIEGMEGLRLARANAAVVTQLRIDDPRGYGAIDHEAAPAFGISFEQVSSSRLDDFAITGEVGGTARVTHALQLDESSSVAVANGFISVRSADFPIQATGRRSSSPANEILGVDVLNNPRGVELRGTSHWDLTNVTVTRDDDCESMDFAFSHVGVASDMVSCTNCIWAGCVGVTPTLGQLNALQSTPVTSLPPPNDFCFTF